MRSCGRIEDENRPLQALDFAVPQIGFRDVALAQMDEKRLTGMVLPTVLHDIKHVIPGQVSLGEALRSMVGERRDAM